MCKCNYPNCNDGHYPVLANEDGDVDWGSCPKCVINFVHICDEEVSDENWEEECDRRFMNYFKSQNLIDVQSGKTLEYPKFKSFIKELLKKQDIDSRIDELEKCDNNNHILYYARNRISELKQTEGGENG